MFIHLFALTATFGGGGKYMPADPAAAVLLPLGPAAALAISWSTFLSARSKPGLSGLPGKVGLLSAKREDRLGLLGPAPSLSLDLVLKLKWFLNGRSFVPPRRLKAIVLGVIGLSAPAADDAV
jgi:hypothetical protein